MYYFSYISHGYSCKNKLEEAVSSVLYARNRQVIPADQLEAFKAGLLAAIDACNQAHPRCKPIRAELYKPEHGKDYHLHMGGGICNLHIYASNDVFYGA